MLSSSSRSLRLAGLVASTGKARCGRGTNVVRLNVRLESTVPSPPVRQAAVSKEERAARRAARKERASAFVSSMGASEGATAGAKGEAAAAAAGKQAPKAGAPSSGPMVDATRLGWAAAVLIPSAFIGWGIVEENSPPAKLSRMIGLTDAIEEYSKPSRTKLLPDWNQIPNIPPDFPPPPVLVLDLENTLVCSNWDRKYGWRHAKRPGVDKFLATMSQYYEIVIWTPSPDGLAAPVIDALDSKGMAMHRLHREATNYVNGVHCKDLSWLNRPLRKVIALDDDEQALQFQPENLIRVKPYDDPNDRDDDTLARITPLLIEISREGYDDIPELLRQFRGMDADAIADEHERRVHELRVRRGAEDPTGIGIVFVGEGLAASELPPNLQGSGEGQPQQLTAKDLVGSAPPSEASESGVIGWLQRRQKQQEEHNKEKFGLWQEVMMKKQAEKKKKMEEAQQAAA